MSTVVKTVVEEVPVADKPVKEKKAKAPKEKKPKSAKIIAHPPYFQMIKESLLALNERTGSSPHAIAKSIEEKHKSVLPASFRKILGLQLKNFSSKGKLIKIKASFKLSEAGKKVTAVKNPAVAVAVAEKKKPAKKTEVAKKKVAAKPAKKKVAQTKKRTAPATTKAKQPKSIKSPAAKKAKKAAA